MIRGFRCNLDPSHTALIDTEINGLSCESPGCAGKLQHDHMVKGGHVYDFAWPGGYPVIWYADIDTVNCVALCAKCAAEERDSGNIETLQPDIHWEGPPEFCEGCGAEIESAYGDPDATDSES